MKVGSLAYTVEALRDKLGGSKPLIVPVRILEAPNEMGEYLVSYVASPVERKPFRCKKVFETKSEALRAPP